MDSRAGFIKTIILVVALLITLAYFGLDIRDFFASDRFRGALEVTGDTLIWIWDRFIVTPALWVWHVIIAGFLWNQVILAVWNAVDL